MVLVSIKKLTDLVNKALRGLGYTDPKDISVIREALLYAEFRGNSQGLIKLAGEALRKSEDAKEISIVRETKVSALLDGGNGLGFVVMRKAMAMAVSKAKDNGFSVVGTNHAHGSTGAIGFWAHRMAEEGLISFVFSGSPPTVVPCGAIGKLFGTNPLAIGVPVPECPVVLDMATSAIAYYSIVKAELDGGTIPPNVAVDKDGNPTTDPSAALEGGILSFDRTHKGSALGLIVEILTGPLVGASFGGMGERNNWGNLIFALDPAILVDVNNFQAETKELLSKLKSLRKMPGVKEIYYPGERGHRATEAVLNRGEIEVEEKIYEALCQKANESET
eukprot:Nk52_evm2s391 gene=Nk52_evmTU2s391